MTAGTERSTTWRHPNPCRRTRPPWYPIDPKEMTMSTKTTANGQERKTLASQLDRLDAILDALGVGLNEAVATAVQDVVGTAVTAAVQAAVIEVLTNPELLERLRPATQTEPAPSLFGRLARKARGLCGWLAGMARAAWHTT